MCLYAICISSLVKHSNHLPVFKLHRFSSSDLYGFFMYLDTISLSDICFALLLFYYFCQSVALSFPSLYADFWRTEIFVLLCVLSIDKKPSPKPGSQRFYLVFSSRSFIVLRFAFRLGYHPFLVNFCVQCKKVVQLHSFACGYPVVPAPFIEKSILFPLSCLGFLVRNQLTIINVKVYFTLSSLFH